MLRVIFFGNSQSVFSNWHFAALRDAECVLMAVIDVPPIKHISTNPAGFAGIENFVEYATRNDIQVFIPDSPNLSDFVESMWGLSPDYFLAVGYTKLLKGPVLSVPRICAINFHASLLPAYRGKHPVFWALRHGERWAGLTVHMIESDFDAGDILYQVKVGTRKRDSVEMLYNRIMDRSVPLVQQFIADSNAGRLQFYPQSAEGVSYYSSIKPEDFRLDWSQDAEQLCRWIWATPGQCFVNLRSYRIFFYDAETIFVPGALAPGVLMRIDRTHVVVATHHGAVRLNQVRVDGNKQTMAQLCRDFGLHVGDPLA